MTVGSYVLDMSWLRSRQIVVVRPVDLLIRQVRGNLLGVVCPLAACSEGSFSGWVSSTASKPQRCACLFPAPYHHSSAVSQPSCGVF